MPSDCSTSLSKGCTDRRHQGQAQAGDLGRAKGLDQGQGQELARAQDLLSLLGLSEA